MADTEIKSSTTQRLEYTLMPKRAVIVPTSPGEPLENKPILSSLPKYEHGSKSSRPIILIVVIFVFLLIGAFVGWWFLFRTTTPVVPVVENNKSDTPTEAIGVTTPAQWRLEYFGTEACADLAECGDEADPDRDGLDNLSEYQSGTDPKNADSDLDGLADGDEVNIFGSNPLKLRSSGNPTYTDGDDAKGGYDTKLGSIKYSSSRLAEVQSLVQKYGFHQPTVSTLGDAVNSIYSLSTQKLSTVLPAGVSASSQAKFDRDTQRLATIKKIGSGLLSYYASKKSYPQTHSFPELQTIIKPYIGTATNFTDPVNSGAFIYTYEPTGGSDFTLTYYSETQSQVVRYHAADATKDSSQAASNQNDFQRMEDLSLLRAALLFYTSSTVDPDGGFKFPSPTNYKSELVPEFITEIPKDPKTNADYSYQTANNNTEFTLTANLEKPISGKTKIVCTQDTECNYQ